MEWALIAVAVVAAVAVAFAIVKILIRFTEKHEDNRFPVFGNWSCGALMLLVLAEFVLASIIGRGTKDFYDMVLIGLRSCLFLTAPVINSHFVYRIKSRAILFLGDAFFTLMFALANVGLAVVDVCLWGKIIILSAAITVILVVTAKIIIRSIKRCARA